MDIFTEPAGSPDTLANLGPLAAMAGTWAGRDGTDDHPVLGGVGHDAAIERYDAQPVDYQTNGPQLLYGLRYHAHVVRPGEVATFHDQVGYWLWEPATCTVMLTAGIPRGESLLAVGRCDPDATTFEVSARRGSTVDGIVANAFLDAHFVTERFRMRVTTSPADRSWAYEEHTTLRVSDRPGVVDHLDRQRFVLLAPPRPNPLALAASPGGPA